MSSQVSAAAPRNTAAVVAPDAGVRANGTCSIAMNPSSADGGSSSRSARICEVGSISHGSRLAAARICSGIGSEPNRSSSAQDEVDLRLGERGVDPHAAGRERVARRRLDHAAAGLAGQVGVIEHGTLDTAGEPVVEIRSDRAQRTATLVAVQPRVTTVGRSRRRFDSSPAPGIPITITISPSSEPAAPRGGRAAPRP